MKNHIAMIHTVPGAADRFERLTKELIGNIKITHLEDGPAREVLLNAGHMTPVVYRRIIDGLMMAEQAGAELIQLTCSSISDIVTVAPHFVNIPVLTVDGPMIRDAVSRGERVLILATAKTALKPVADQVEKHAAAISRNVKITTRLCEEAYPYLISGSTDRYYELIKECLVKNAVNQDVVIIAQASMVGCLALIGPEELQTPVLSSPRSAVEHLRDRLVQDEGSSYA